MQTGTILLADDIGNTINRYILVQMNLTAIFIVSCFVFVRRGFGELWVGLFLVMCAILCVVGIWEWRLQRVPWAGHIPSFLRVQDETVLKILRGSARAASGIYRVQGPATTPLGFAELLGLAVPFAVHMMVEQYRWLARVAAAAFIPLAIFVILLTDSRLGVVAALASVLFYILGWALLRRRQFQNSLLVPAILLAYPSILIAGVASTFFVGRIRAEVWGNGAQTASNDARVEQWEMAIPIILRNPFGRGTGQGADALGWANQAGTISIDSYYLSVLLEWGVIGFLLFYGLMLRGVWVAGMIVVKHQVEREVRLVIPLAVALLNFVIIKSVLSQDANHPLAFMMLGAVLALGYRAAKTSAESDIKPPTLAATAMAKAAR